jgi:MerR family transcriptional regulator, light-induced transcriptional regulator
MVYIRIKKIKNIDYVYLVESKWNKEKHASQQVIKQYLGPVAQMNINKIPEEYRNESTIIKFLTSHNLDLSKSMKYNESLQEKLFEMLKSNEINSLIKFYDEYTKLNYLLIDFYENIDTCII